MKKSLHTSEIRNHKSAILLSSVFCLLTSVVFAGFDFNARCQQAQMEILDLRTQTARQILSEEKADHPGNAYVLYLEHFADVIDLIATDHEQLYEGLLENYSYRTQEMDRLDNGSPYNSLLQAEMLFYTGLAQLKFGTQISGAGKIYNSYHRVRKHLEEYPDFFYHLKMAGMYNIMTDFIPKQVRWITDILGVRGDSKMGMDQLMEYFDKVKTTPGLAQEAVLIINLACKLTWQDEQALEFMSSQPDALTGNALASYVWAISATYCFKNDLALDLLNGIDREKLEVPFYSLDYVTGRCMLNRLEEHANLPLEKYLEEYPGEDFKKDACNRLSYHYFLQGDVERYREYKARVNTIGQLLRERDLEAAKESYSEIQPHEGLLKARLMFDGGYFHRADSIISSIAIYTLNRLPYKLEHTYRKGRVKQALGITEKAVEYLEKAFREGREQPYTFACRAALQLAAIYEAQGDWHNAFTWYSHCLEVYDDAHTVSSVEDKARKGRKRAEQWL